ncbi:MAG: hypothetical protein ACRDL2_01710 [Gaiellaceae bacterium]
MAPAAATEPTRAVHRYLLPLFVPALLVLAAAMTGRYWAEHRTGSAA